MANRRKDPSGMHRRRFLQLSAATLGAAGTAGVPDAIAAESVYPTPDDRKTRAVRGGSRRPYNAEYTGPYLNRVAFPLGGLGAGMICLEGTGALSHVSIHNKPEVFNEPLTFAAISIKGAPASARVLEGQVPGWKLFGSPGTGKTTCAFFRPGSSEILFASTHADPNSKRLQEEEIAFRASGQQRRYSWDFDPAMDISAYDEKTGTTKRLTTTEGYDAEGD